MSHTIDANGATLTGDSDFSGEVEIRWPSDDVIGDGARAIRPMDAVRMPGHVFLALAKMAVGQELGHAIGRAIDAWILDGSDPSTTHGGGAGTR